MTRPSPKRDALLILYRRSPHMPPAEAARRVGCALAYAIKVRQSAIADGIAADRRRRPLAESARVLRAAGAVASGRATGYTSATASGTSRALPAEKG